MCLFCKFGANWGFVIFRLQPWKTIIVGPTCCRLHIILSRLMCSLVLSFWDKINVVAKKFCILYFFWAIVWLQHWMTVQYIRFTIILILLFLTVCVKNYVLLIWFCLDLSECITQALWLVREWALTIFRQINTIFGTNLVNI